MPSALIASSAIAASHKTKTGTGRPAESQSTCVFSPCCDGCHGTNHVGASYLEGRRGWHYPGLRGHPWSQPADIRRRLRFLHLVGRVGRQGLAYRPAGDPLATIGAGRAQGLGPQRGGSQGSSVVGRRVWANVQGPSSHCQEPARHDWLEASGRNSAELSTLVVVRGCRLPGRRPMPLPAAGRNTGLSNHTSGPAHLDGCKSTKRRALRGRTGSPIVATLSR